MTIKISECDREWNFFYESFMASFHITAMSFILIKMRLCGDRPFRPFLPLIHSIVRMNIVGFYCSDN